MACLKFEGIWQLLSTNDFKEDISEEFLCIICKNVTIEPFTAICECRFCSDCIKYYLKDGKKHCPGVRNDCKEEYLEIDVNVSKDLKAVRSLGRISVKCPNEMCEVRCELENMDDHLRVCGMSKYRCPYENIGCQLRQMSRDNVKTHYDNEWFSHSKLLVEAIDNLRNDVEELWKVFKRKDEEVNKLNEDSSKKEITIQEMRIEIKIMKEINETKDIEMEEMKEKFRMLEETQKMTMEKLDNLKKDIVERDLDNYMTIKEMRVEIKTLKEINEIKDREMEEMKKEFRLMKETLKKTMMEELETVKEDIAKSELNNKATILTINRQISDQFNEIKILKTTFGTKNREIERMREEFTKTKETQMKIMEELKNKNITKPNILSPERIRKVQKKK